jgi:hypothetical protein
MSTRSPGKDHYSWMEITKPFMLTCAKNILLFGTGLLLLHSCTLEKRLYRQGFYMDRMGAEHPTASKHPFYFIASKTNAIHPDTRPESSRVGVKNDLEKNPHEGPVQQNIRIKDPRPVFHFLKRTHVQPKEHHFIKYRQAAGNFGDLMGWLLGLIIVAGIMFLLGLGLRALFPGLSLLLAMGLGVIAFFLLIFLLVLIVGVH